MSCVTFTIYAKVEGQGRGTRSKGHKGTCPSQIVVAINDIYMTPIKHNDLRRVKHHTCIVMLKVKVAGQNHRSQIGLASKIYVASKDIEANLVHTLILV